MKMMEELFDVIILVVCVLTLLLEVLISRRSLPALVISELVEIGYI